MSVDLPAVRQAVTALLRAVGEDPDRPGLTDTPQRVARWWAELMDYRDTNTTTTFDGVMRLDQVVAVTGIRTHSVCEHHLLPMSLTVDVGYMACNGTVLGLSKVPRIVHVVAHRLQVQERLTEEIADAIADAAGTKDVAVVVAGRHLCVEMRGVRTPAEMRTSVIRGRFRDNGEARAEFLALVR